LLTHRQTDKQKTKSGKNITSLAEVMTIIIEIELSSRASKIALLTRSYNGSSTWLMSWFSCCI